MCFSPSGTHFVTGDNMGELYLWDMSAVKVRQMLGHVTIRWEVTSHACRSYVHV